MTNGVVYFKGSCFKTATAYILKPLCITKSKTLFILKQRIEK